MRILRSLMICSALCFGMLPGFETSSRAQCAITFSPNPGTGTLSIESYWAINGFNFSLPAPALFQDIVAVGNSTVPANAPGAFYLGWCMDITNDIANGPETYTTGDVFMYASCDPGLNKELNGLATLYGFTYPSTDTNTTAAEWNAVNYILNHPVSGASYWDVQVAIFNFVGGPPPADPPSSFYSTYAGLASVYHPALVTEIVNNAMANPTWQPQCGNVVAVVVAIISDGLGDFPAQLTILQVPVPYVPTASCVSITAVANVAITPVTLTASGGTGGYTFTATGLPTGITISPSGTISGTPTVSGTFPYTVMITDSAGDKGTLNCSVTVSPPPSASCVGITAVEGVPITPVTLVGAGGVGGPYTFTATGLPPGLTLSSTGTISGAPTATGTFGYTVTITDKAGNQGTAGCAVTVDAPPGASCVTITAVEDVAITPVSLVGTGGVGGPYTFTASGLPNGITISSSGTISGTATVSGTFSYTVTITDKAGNTGTLNCSVTVSPPSCPCSPQSIAYNFNGTQIIFQSTPGGSYVWFISDGTVNGLPATPVTLHISDQSITIPATGSSPQYTVPVPDSWITFSPSVTVATTVFDTVHNDWVITLPSQGLAGNVFYGGMAFKVPAAGLPGGIQNVLWTGKFTTATTGLNIHWQWSAAAYSDFTSDYNAIEAKPVDDNKASVYQNSDHAGTPEGTDSVSGKLWQSFVIGGASGGGGGNYTGSGSSTIQFPPCVCPNP